MSGSIELARDAYKLLVNKYPDGLTREQLAARLGVKDRDARDAVNMCRVLAAENPKPDGSVYIVGFDPEVKRYVAAQNIYQARRVIAYQESRVLDINRGLDAQKQAFKRIFKTEYRGAEQRSVFDVKQELPAAAEKHTRYDVTGKTFRPCRACGTPITFVESEAGKPLPVTRSGYSHYLDCTDPKQFSRSSKKTDATPSV